MDRRILLAAALAILVLFLNSLLFRPQQQGGQRPTLTNRDSTEKTVPTRSAEPPEIRTPSISLPAGLMLQDVHGDKDESEIITVQTDLIRAEFDPLGATVRSWQLLRYTDAEEEPADLVRTRDLGALWFALRDGDRVIRTDETLFRASVVRERTETVVRFVAEDPSGISLEKTYRVPADRYDCRLEVRVDGIGEEGPGGAWEVGWIDGLPILERNPKWDQAAIASVGLFGKEYARTGPGGGAFGCGGGGGGTKSEVREGTLRWMGVRNKYFLGALLLDEPRDRRIIMSFEGANHTAGALLLEPLSYSGHTEASYRMYLGPIHYGTLASYRASLERVQDLGPGILRPFSKLLMKFFEALNAVIPNYGFLILILSVLVRVIFYPLTKKSMESMKRMQGLKPEMERINEKYKDDPERKNREIMGLYRKKKINPLGGCLPLLVQLPVLSGLYYVLSHAIQLRKEPFILWIRDLSAPDTVTHIAGFPLNILPLIMAGTMVWQQKMTPTDPRQKSIGYMMPIFMTFLFYSMSSGLVFYWTVSNLMTVLQQIWMNRGLKDSGEQKEEEEDPRGLRSARRKRKPR